MIAMWSPSKHLLSYWSVHTQMGHSLLMFCKSVLFSCESSSRNANVCQSVCLSVVRQSSLLFQLIKQPNKHSNRYPDVSMDSLGLSKGACQQTAPKKG